MPFAARPVTLAGLALALVFGLPAWGCGAGASTEGPALWFGGDVHLGGEPRATLTGVRALVGTAPGIVNLEGPIVGGPGFAQVSGGEGGPPRVRLANPDSTGSFLKRNGIVAASIANNHQADGGGGPLTAARLRGAAVVPFGAGAGPARLLVGQHPVLLFAHDLAEKDVPAAVGRDLVGRPEAEGAVTVESFHVTGPPSYLPTPELIAAVDAAVLAGADIVVAHGTHMVGPVERRGGTVIAWGLGNLLFDCTCTDADEAIVLRVSLGAGHPAEVFPVRAGLGGQGAVPAPDPGGILDLVGALGGTAMARRSDRGVF